ncbi:hypothetical protein F5877DRAFT_86804 [Lentinula edodes]|nr:hypothetical protein F5877DRAFT_86804 [Lentinula edodes]
MILAVSLFTVFMGNKNNSRSKQSVCRKNKNPTQEIEEDQLSSGEALTPNASLRPPCPTPRPYHRGIPAYDNACHSNSGAEIDDTAATRLMMLFSRVSPSKSQATPACTHPMSELHAPFTRHKGSMPGDKSRTIRTLSHPQSACQTSRLLTPIIDYQSTCYPSPSTYSCKTWVRVGLRVGFGIRSLCCSVLGAGWSSKGAMETATEDRNDLVGAGIERYDP